MGVATQPLTNQKTHLLIMPGNKVNVDMRQVKLNRVLHKNLYSSAHRATCVHTHAHRVLVVSMLTPACINLGGQQWKLSN